MLLSFDIPESREPRIEWLESQIAGVNLARIVAEFRAVHRIQKPAEESLGQLLGDQTDDVMQQGLVAISDSQIQSLLKNPGSLFELQEQILLEGSTHWQNLGQSTDVESSFNPRSLAESAMPAPSSSLAAPSTTSPKSAWYSHPALVSLVTAACVLIATNLYHSNRPPVVEKVAVVDPAPVPPSPVPPTPVPPVKSGWGWDRPGALNQDAKADAYLNALADAADDWFKKRPADASSVAKRIAQFRQGCSTLILTEHTALADADRTWLVEKCRLWAGKLDEHLAAVEAGEPVLDIRAAADETINKLIKAIRARAETLA